MALQLTSSAFDDGETILQKYGYTFENVNPPLAIENVPENAQSLVLIMDDPDAVEPAGKVWDHWVVFNIPPDTREIPEDWGAANAIEGQTDFDEVGYGGPAPPDREHTYVFTLYALDTTIDLDSSATKEDVESAIEGHVITQTELTGMFAPQ